MNEQTQKTIASALVAIVPVILFNLVLIIAENLGTPITHGLIQILICLSLFGLSIITGLYLAQKYKAEEWDLITEENPSV